MQKITVTLKQASEVSGLSIRKLYDLIAEKKLRSTTVGRRRLIGAQSLEELLLGKAASVSHGARRNRSEQVQAEAR